MAQEYEHGQAACDGGTKGCGCGQGCGDCDVSGAGCGGFGRGASMNVVWA